MTVVGDIRAAALAVAAAWTPPDQPESWRLTAALFGAIAAHDDLLDALSALPPDTMPALLASAAIAYLARRAEPTALTAYFPVEGLPQPRFDDHFGRAFEEFVAAMLPDIMAVCASRRYQMTEVARCAQVALGIAAVRGQGQPIALIDIGTGAGFSLRLDQYRFEIGGQRAGPASAGLTLTCEVLGDREPPRVELPVIARRAGVELNPVDLDDPGARAWLEACTPPEASALARLGRAIEISRRSVVPIVAGDVIDVLPGVLEAMPRELPVVVTDSYLAVFMPAPARARLLTILAEAGSARPVSWVSLDPLVPLGPSGRDSVQGLEVPESLVSDYRAHGVFAVLGVRTFDRAAEGGTLLARAHPSGHWLEWLAAP